MMKNVIRMMFLASIVAALGSVAMAVDIETVPVGNPGNTADTTGYGGVSYEYNIGMYEVTAGQYCEFLNAVAKTDTYGLYNGKMNSDSTGCQITRLGTIGNYTYDFSGKPSGTATDWADRPVNFVSWGDAARFANWLHNGQLTGWQDMTTTEDGAYYLNGAMSNAELLTVSRKVDDWKWAITSEDEWYKAAYYDGAASSYYDYPTSSDTVPGYVNDSGNLSGTGNPFTEGGTDPGNYATYDGDGGTDGIGSPYYRTIVGEWEKSDSPYGTFDQGGNVYEWNEAIIIELKRGLRGGAYNVDGSNLPASYRNSNVPTNQTKRVGFRVSEFVVPEPTTMVWRTDETADWTSENWTLDGSTFIEPTADKAMVVNSGKATVWTDVSDTAAGSLSITALAPATDATVEIASGGSLVVTGGVNVGDGGTLNVNGTLSMGALNVDVGGTMTLNGGSMIVSPAAAGGADVTITLGGTLAGGDGVSSLGEFLVDTGFTHLTLAADSTYEQTFTFDGLSSELNGESLDMVEGNRVDVWGNLTLGDDVTIRLVDNGGSADGEDVVLFRAAAGIVISTYSIELPDDWTSGGLLVDDFNGLLILQNLITVTGPLPGDANGNGVVGDADWVIFKAQFGGAPGGVDDDADFNDDGRVDLRDLAILDAAWNGGAGAPEMDATVIPEPATMSLLTIGGLLVLGRRRRKA